MNNLWSPPRGVGLLDEYDEEFEDEEDLFDEMGGVSGNGLGDELGSQYKNAPKKTFQERSSLPKWLSDDYADARERIAAEMRQNPSRKPTCYDKGSFFDNSPSPFFAADRKFQPTPHDFHKAEYFIWLPHLLVDRIPCPECLTTSRKGRNGVKPVYVTNNGWPKGARRVVDVDRCVYIIGYRY
ncbi:hypothetical protein M413DRAFT_32970 [Hebeloma cylindrosporum]|uniref:Uncharacterized protein n=1 Tax=Hebeloma cylindrosporum TaxID=76867 RepID=A0A0C3BRZ9_HEBCY|nr:hypothetical protein M413DRAFT_32970 [Hebeloma cylindrosporum h7]